MENKIILSKIGEKFVKMQKGHAKLIYYYMISRFRQNAFCVKRDRWSQKIEIFKS